VPVWHHTGEGGYSISFHAPQEFTNLFFKQQSTGRGLCVFGKFRISGVTTICSLVKTLSLGAILALAGLSLSNVVIGVEPPTSVVKGTIDEVIRLVTDDGLKEPDQTDNRRKLLEETIGQHFDFEEMTKRSLASHWRNRSEPEQQEFVTLFQTLLSKTYAGKIENYSGEQVRYLKERLKDSFAEVQTRIVSKKTEIALDYRLLLKDGNWRVYDVVVDGVSLVKNYRVQFDRIIRDSTYEELVKTLREKSSDITAP
jgi:phospholipid transport system substrate-binding protein